MHLSDARARWRENLGAPDELLNSLLATHTDRFWLKGLLSGKMAHKIFHKRPIQTAIIQNGNTKRL